MFFYELHEGDDEVYSDVILYSDSEWEPDEFFDLVQTVRRRIQDSLIEAIATVLEREHGFLYVSDDRLSASVNVSKQEDDNFLAEIDSELDDEDEDEDDTDANGRADADYVTINAELDFDRGSRTN